MIKVVDLVQHYGVVPVLTGVNMEVAEGELVAIMGPNGMGKSTLLAAIAGALTPQRGHIEIRGLRRRTTVEAEQAIRGLVYYLPDSPWLPMTQPGRHYLLAVGNIYGVPDDRLFGHIERLGELFHLKQHLDAPITSYSAGQRKKIALAGALVSDAPVLILDEPFSGGLDPAGLLAMRKVLKHLADRSDRTVLMAAPVPELLDGLVNRLGILRKGVLENYATPDELRRQTGVDGPLVDVVEALMEEDIADEVSQYLEGEQK